MNLQPNKAKPLQVINNESPKHNLTKKTKISCEVSNVEFLLPLDVILYNNIYFLVLY